MVFYSIQSTTNQSSRKQRSVINTIVLHILSLPLCLLSHLMTFSSWWAQSSRVTFAGWSFHSELYSKVSILAYGRSCGSRSFSHMTLLSIPSSSTVLVHVRSYTDARPCTAMILLAQSGGAAELNWYQNILNRKIWPRRTRVILHPRFPLGWNVFHFEGWQSRSFLVFALAGFTKKRINIVRKTARHAIFRWFLL